MSWFICATKCQFKGRLWPAGYIQEFEAETVEELGCPHFRIYTEPAPDKIEFSEDKIDAKGLRLLRLELQRAVETIADLSREKGVLVKDLGKSRAREKKLSADLVESNGLVDVLRGKLLEVPPAPAEPETAPDPPPDEETKGDKAKPKGKGKQGPQQDTDK